MTLRNNRAFTLVELLVSIAILAIIMTGLYQVLATAISIYADTKEKQELVAQARYAMERMAMFVRETDTISSPDDINQELLRVSERVLDNYDNSTHTYNVVPDGLLDADNDSDGLVNEGGGGSHRSDNLRPKQDRCRQLEAHGRDPRLQHAGTRGFHG
ncbi:MAG: prepilin-type N-terminal cleavage/methylation domain-containing protein [Desulfobacteraceae bacterium]|nr:prepilin-type N-terminal cleavage/methylation domain-containing protein [Desulfobacteraceae bacterium]